MSSLQDYKKFQVELLKERKNLEREERKWRYGQVRLSQEEHVQQVCRHFESKQARSEMMEANLKQLQKAVSRQHKQRLLARDEASEELHMRYVTGDWNKTREQLFFPSRFMVTAPLPRCASDLGESVTHHLDANLSSQLGSFLPPRSAGLTPNSSLRVKTPDEFARALLEDERSILSRTPKLSRGGTPALAPVLEQPRGAQEKNVDRPLKADGKSTSNAEVKVHVEGKADMQNIVL